MRTALLRAFGRVGVGVAVVAASGLLAAPAHADSGADLAVSFTGTTLSNVPGKFGKFALTNKGPGLATGVVVTFDVSALDETKASIALPGCPAVGDVITCTVDDADAPAPGATYTELMAITKVGSDYGSAGSITVSVSSTSADPDATNNTATAEVVLTEENSVDLTVVVDDVYALDSEGDPTTDPVPPGETSEVWVDVANLGNVFAVGIKLVVTLPEHVTFTETEAECTYSPDNRVATCSYPDVTITPLVYGDGHWYASFYWPVKVAADAPGPGFLPNGLVTVEAIDTNLVTEVPDIGNDVLPRNARWKTDRSIAEQDESDNADDFVVFVGAGDDFNGLPSTGNRAGLLAGAGAAVLVLGVALFLISRRRRMATTPIA